jgi:phosphoglycolate phosphatase
MIKLVAFDWNGTLFSDTKACTKAVNEVLKVLGKKPVTVRDYQDHFDVPVTKTYIGLGITEKDVTTKSALIAKTFHTNYENKAQNLRTRANARKLLTWLHNRHISSIIFSNHIKNKIELQLKRLQIDNYFEGVLANALIQAG